MSQIYAWRPDAIVVVAYGQFLRKPLLELPRFGCVNCHFSLLPKYRGASPVTAAIAAGDKMTGVTVMHMGVGMDDGPMMLQSYVPIYSDSTGGALMDELAVTGGLTLAKALVLMSRGELPQEVPQNDAEATFARKLKKTDGFIDWSAPVLEIERKVRAFNPWPGCYTFLPERFRRKGNSGRVVVASARIVRDMKPGWREAAPGTVLELVTACPRDRVGEHPPTGPVVKCGDTALMLTELKPEGGSLMYGAPFLRGRPLEPMSDTLLSE
jgi:methionyl-tRNA formyltransferase